MRPPPLDALARSLAGPFAFVGLAMSRGGQDQFAIQTAPDVTASMDTLFRVASLTKVVMGRVLARVMAAQEVAPPYALDVSGVVDLPPNPHENPTQKLTFGMLASHCAGLADMVVPPHVALPDFLRNTPDVWLAPGGTHFTYSNLGYVVLAAALEAATGQRLDQLTAPVLADLGIPGGLNWAGVAAADRAAALPTYRGDRGHFDPQVDAKVPPTGVILSDGTLFDLGAYKPGRNPACFAPQGGLRTSLRGLLTLAKALPDGPQTPLWRTSDGPGDYLEGLMQDYGAGVQILPEPPFYPRPLIGHFGNAYGFRGGVWWDAEAEFSFAYALNGAPMGDESDALTPAELRIFQTLAEVP